MVKNTKGGKGAKGLARKSQTGFSSVIRYSNDELEQYGCVTKMFGNGMCQITLEDEKTLIGHIRNKFRGRQKRHNTINIYCVVLIGLREWEKTPKNCDILFYRGSSSVIEASCKGLIPLYIEKQNELSLDVLYKIEKYKPKIKSIRDFYKFYNNYKNNYYKYNLKKTEKIIDYCRSYYSLIDKKTINKIINN